MAGTSDDTTPITLISPVAARDLAVESLLSPRWTELQIIKWLHQRRVRWQYEIVVGQPRPGRTLEQEAEALWAQPTRVLVDWQEGCAHRVTVYRKDKTGCLKPLRRVTVVGIHIVREDIERELAQMPRTLVGSIAAANPRNPPQQPQLSVEESLSSLRTEYFRIPERRRAVWMRDVGFPRMQHELGKRARWNSWESLRRAMYAGRKKNF
jgi:hypothetical protein